MKKIAISLALVAALLVAVSCSGRTVSYLAPLSGQITIVAASNIAVTATDYTNGLGTYQTTVWTAAGSVVVRDTVGDVGLNLQPGAISVQFKTQKYNSTWGGIGVTFPANTANNTNIAKAAANTNDKITLNYSQTTTTAVAGTSYTNTSGAGALTYSFRGSYTLGGINQNGVNITGASDVVFTATEVMQNVPATLSTAFALTN